MVLKIEITGLEQCQKYMNDKTKSVLEEVNQSVIKAGLYIQAEVQESIAGRKAEPTSVDTGRFLNSVKSEQDKILTATISTNVEYAPCLEFGTTRMSPRKHFGNTVVRNESKVKDFVNEAVNKAIKKV